MLWIFQHLQRHRRFVECDSIVISGLGPFETQHSHLIYLALSHHCELLDRRDLPSMSPRRMRRHSTFRNSCQKRDFSHAERNTSSSGVQESLQNALLQTPCIDGSLQDVTLLATSPSQSLVKRVTSVLPYSEIVAKHGTLMMSCSETNAKRSASEALHPPTLARRDPLATSPSQILVKRVTSGTRVQKLFPNMTL